MTQADVDELLNDIDRPDRKDKDFIAQVLIDAKTAGVDDANALAQHIWETADQTAPRWNADTDGDGYIDLNPGGIGIPANSTVQPFRINNVKEASAIFVNCIYAMVKKEAHPDLPIPESAKDWWNKVWLKKVRSKNFPKVETRADLNKHYQDFNDSQATWAWDSYYVTGTGERMNKYVPGLKDQQSGGGTNVPTTTGNVPKPPYMEHYIARINAVAGKNCSEQPRTIRATFHHTEQGSFLGTAGWFDNPNNGALTDFQIGGPWDGIYDGVIMRFIEEDMDVAPYASGRVGDIRPPFGEAKKFLDAFGGDADLVNTDARSIELSDGGAPDRGHELTGRQIESLAFLTAYVHAVEAGQRWDTFAYQCQHYETGAAHSGCPGAWLKDPANRAAVRARAIEIMKAYQTGAKMSRPLLVTYPPNWTGGVVPQPGPKAPTYLPPQQLPFPLNEELEAPVEFEGVWYLPTAMTYTAIKDTGRNQTAEKNSGLVGPMIRKGTKFRSFIICRSKDGVSNVLTTHGTFVRAAALDPKVSITKSGRISIRYAKLPGQVKVDSSNVDEVMGI